MRRGGLCSILERKERKKACMGEKEERKFHFWCDCLPGQKAPKGTRERQTEPPRAPPLCLRVSCLLLLLLLLLTHYLSRSLARSLSTHTFKRSPTLQHTRQSRGQGEKKESRPDFRNHGHSTDGPRKGPPSHSHLLLLSTLP